MLLLPLFACGPEASTDVDEPEDTDPAGQNRPAYCAESGRVTVEDPPTAAAGLSFSAQDVLDAHAGAWSGTFTAASEATSTIMITMARPDGGGAIEAVTYTLVDPGGSAVAATDCPSAYDLAVVVTLFTGDGLLAETVDATLHAPSVEGPRWTQPVADVHGRTEPTAFSPADGTELMLEAHADADAWLGSAAWFAGDAPDSGASSPSGRSEAVGGWVVTR